MRRFPHGLTLLELLVCLVILSLLLTLAIPAFSDLRQRSSNATLSTQLLNLVQYARTESIVRRDVVTLCGSQKGLRCDGNWSRYILVFRDKNRDGQLGPGDYLLRAAALVPEGDQLSWRVFGNKPYLQLHPDGRTRYQNGNFTYCPASGNAHHALHWLLNGSGRLRRAPDRNGNGIPEKSNGRDLTCR